MKIAIVQSCYIPWRGYFDLISQVDTFVFLDDVQLTKRDWRTRNAIKTPQGLLWLTVPVQGGRDQLICEAQIIQDGWQKNHFESLRHNYARAAHWNKFPDHVNWLYFTSHSSLSEFNQKT